MLQKISQISTDLFTSWGKGHTGFFHSSLVLANCHIDTNHFTPYNDAYGFSRGDEVIDFVFIVPLKHAEPICKILIANFNIIVFDPFGEEEKAGGDHVAMGRGGVEQKIPSLGHVDCRLA